MAKRGGARPGAGQKGYGKSVAVRQAIEKLTPGYFALLEFWMKDGEKEDQRFAMTQLSRLIEKTIPQEHTGDLKLNHSLDVPESVYKAVLERERNRIKISGD
jgi:hypothetical protein